MKDLPILITGAGGMLGSHLAEALRRDGYTNLTLASRKHFETDLKLEIGDLKDWNFLLRIIEGKHTIIHAASKISYSDLDFDTLMVENTLVMRSMIDLALEYDVPNFIYISSTSTLFRSGITDSINEESTWKSKIQTSPYGTSKFYGELEWARGMAEGLNGHLLLPSVIIPEKGFYHQNFGKNIKMLEDGFEHYPSGIGGFVAVSDISKIIIEILEKKIPQGKYVISAENLSYKDVFEIIHQALDLKTTLTPLKKWKLNLAVILNSVQEKLFRKSNFINKHTASLSTSHFEYDNTKILEHTQIKFKPIKEAIQEYVQNYLKEKGAKWDKPLLEIHKPDSVN